MSQKQARQIAIFASGTGTNAQNIISYLRDNDHGVQVALVISNKADARVLERARNLGIDTAVLSRDDINNPDITLPLLDNHHIGTIVLAGFLLMIPEYLIKRYDGHMVNIHPSLLPRFGGKGMYGRHVHEAVVAAGEHMSGITIHLVSEHYDEGRILFQATVPVDTTDTADEVARKVQRLEHDHYPRIVAMIAKH